MIGKGKGMPSPRGGMSDAEIVAQVLPSLGFRNGPDAREVADLIVKRHAEEIRAAVFKLTLGA